MAAFFTTQLWPGLLCWMALYASDATFTIRCARMYAQGVRETLAYEGSYELNPYFQKAVDAGRLFSPRIVIGGLAGAFALAVVWWATRSRLWADAYVVYLGFLIGTQLAVHVRHFRNVRLFRAVLKGEEIRGRAEYGRGILLSVSATEFLAFALLYSVTFIATGSWFVFGGAVGCLGIAGSHWRLARRHRARAQRPAVDIQQPDR